MAARVNTATLIRGEIYTLRHPDSTPAKPIESLKFEYGKPVTIKDNRILKMLEDMVDEVVDGEDEVYEKPRFRIDRGVREPDAVTTTKRTRLSANRSVKKTKRLKRA